MRTVTFTAAEIVDLFAAIEIAIEELDYRAEETMIMMHLI